MRTHGWPLVLSLANIAVERRNEEGGHALGAIFPILHAVPGHPGERALKTLVVKGQGSSKNRLSWTQKGHALLQS